MKVYTNEVGNYLDEQGLNDLWDKIKEYVDTHSSYTDIDLSDYFTKEEIYTLLNELQIPAPNDIKGFKRAIIDDDGTLTITLSDDTTVNVGNIKGYSAYDIAVKNGFVGTEKEWIESLKPNTSLLATTDYVNTQLDKKQDNIKDGIVTFISSFEGNRVSTIGTVPQIKTYDNKTVITFERETTLLIYRELHTDTLDKSKWERYTGTTITIDTTKGVITDYIIYNPAPMTNSNNASNPNILNVSTIDYDKEGSGELVEGNVIDFSKHFLQSDATVTNVSYERTDIVSKIEDTDDTTYVYLESTSTTDNDKPVLDITKHDNSLYLATMKDTPIYNSEGNRVIPTTLNNKVLNIALKVGKTYTIQCLSNNVGVINGSDIKKENYAPVIDIEEKIKTVPIYETIDLNTEENSGRDYLYDKNGNKVYIESDKTIRYRYLKSVRGISVNYGFADKELLKGESYTFSISDNYVSDNNNTRCNYITVICPTEEDYNNIKIVEGNVSYTQLVGEDSHISFTSANEDKTEVQNINISLTSNTTDNDYIRYGNLPITENINLFELKNNSSTTVAGKDGKDGITYTPKVKSVTTLDANSEAKVKIEIEGTDVLYSFGIPKGEKGDKGDKGDKGESSSGGATGGGLSKDYFGADTTPIVVGKWIDGKPIYRWVREFSTPNAECSTDIDFNLPSGFTIDTITDSDLIIDCGTFVFKGYMQQDDYIPYTADMYSNKSTVADKVCSIYGARTSTWRINKGGYIHGWFSNIICKHKGYIIVEFTRKED